jgi:pimeloyl-ACP methyl ester carboxylesterase
MSIMPSDAHGTTPKAMPAAPVPYRTTSYARPHAPLLFARRIPTPDGAELATFVYGPDGGVSGGAMPATNVSGDGTPGTVEAGAAALDALLADAPFLLLHGNGGSHGSFCKVIDTLVCAGKAVVAFDARAQGLSSRGSEPRLSYELFARDAICVLDALGVSGAHVIGHSDGGIEALLLARDYPSRVRSIVVGGANLTPEGVIDEWDSEASARVNRTWAAWAKGACPTDTIDPTLLPDATDALWASELLQLMLDEPQIDAASLASISCPSCVIVGEHDCITPEQTHAIARAIPGARLVVVPGVGHSLPRQAPDSVCCQALINVCLAR